MFEDNLNKFESKENLPRNLKLYSEETFAAMRRIEGETWGQQQDEKFKSSGKLTYSVAGALRWLNDEGPNDTGTESYTVHGLGGSSRWYVSQNGGVRFSKRHGSPRTAALAEKEGFEIS